MVGRVTSFGTQAAANRLRYAAQADGHYESYFIRANHPLRPVGFWFRYTIFSPRGDSTAAEGEIWAIVFNGETGRHLALKQSRPLGQCQFGSALPAEIGDALLMPDRAVGGIGQGKRSIAWDLDYAGSGPPLLLLPERRYTKRFPAAKALVSLPLARFDGAIAVDGETIQVEGWSGSQNHNWGSRHTDHYAWGQVAGFASHPESFLEVATAQLKLGPFWSPAFTPMVLRHRRKEYRLTGLVRALRATAKLDRFTFDFASRNAEVELLGSLSAPAETFVGLAYRNPSGGAKQCLNSKLASCRLRITDRTRGESETLVALNRAAFEILTDDTGHGIALQA